MTAPALAEPAPLGNHAKSAAAPGHGGFDLRRSLAASDAREARRDARRKRYSSRAKLWDLSDLPRVRSCGRVSVIEGGIVQLRGKAGNECRAGYGGLATCGSVWACPVCSAKIAMTRIAEMQKAIAWNDARGGVTALATFTLSHHSGQTLTAVWDGLSTAWRKMTNKRAWRKLRKGIGNDHYIRVVEVTYGVNGWHVHVHVVLFFDHQVESWEVKNLEVDLYVEWHKALSALGLKASREHGVDIRRCSTGLTLEKLGEYLNKMAFEAMGGRFKKGRAGGRNPHEILSDVLATGLADDMDLWWDWERGSKGRQQVVWSNGFKDAVGIDDVTDEEIAAALEDGATYLEIPGVSWREMRHVAVELLEAFESGGMTGAAGWLDYRGLPFEFIETGALRSPPDRPVAGGRKRRP